jgi:valyl-tRNA synthetase
MSKSLGNIIDPLLMIEKYGADATRLSLVVGAQPGNDMKLSEDRVRGYKHFANKLWNIARFVFEHSDESVRTAPLTESDTALLSEAQTVVDTVTRHIEQFRLDLAADSIYHYVWDRFAAEILEESKQVIKDDLGGSAVDPTHKASRKRVLYEILMLSLKLLHPFMPFITEAIWQLTPNRIDTKPLMVASWPKTVAH